VIFTWRSFCLPCWWTDGTSV